MNNSDVQRAKRGASLLSASLCGATAVLVVVAGPLPATADDNGGRRQIEVVDPGETLFRKSYQELTGEWANWLQKEPVATSPAFDLDGGFCDLNQKGKIWFLAGTFGGVADRFCQVPAGKGVFFPIFAFISFAPEFLNQPPCDADALEEKLDQIRCDVNDDIPIAPNVALDVTIDGESLPDLFAYRIQSEPGGFTFDLGPLFEDFGLPAGERSPAVIDGYWILLEPLPPGLHTVTFIADFDPFGAGSLQGANYELLVPGPPPRP